MLFAFNPIRFRATGERRQNDETLPKEQEPNLNKTRFTSPPTYDVSSHHIKEEGVNYFSFFTFLDWIAHWGIFDAIVGKAHSNNINDLRS
jgi:hypothetical protein